jgi:hypothetical protein
MPRPLPDLAGQRFGRWTVLRPVRRGRRTAWFCRCDCGAELVVDGGSLASGASRSCGCLKREEAAARFVRLNAEGRLYHQPPADFTNQRFGRLVALRRTRGGRSPEWLCRCDCGALTPVLAANLRSGNTTSCGCYRRERAAEILAVGFTPTFPAFCRVCGDEFLAVAKQWFCSTECSHRARYPFLFRFCAVCGTRFRTHSGKVYCGPDCLRTAADRASERARSGSVTDQMNLLRSILEKPHGTD